MAANWSVHKKEFTTSDIRIAIKDGLPKTTRDVLDDHLEDYCSLTYEDWCDLLSTSEVKYERKRAELHIKKIAFARSASVSNNNKYVRITRRKKAKTGVLSSKKSPRRAHDRQYGAHRYCVLCRKAGMPERKYASHSSEDFTGVTKRSIKDGMGGPIGSRTHDVQHNKKYENNWKKYLEALNKQKKMLHSIAKKSGLRREIKNSNKINNIKAEDFKKTSVSSSQEWDCNSSIERDSR